VKHKTKAKLTDYNFSYIYEYITLNYELLKTVKELIRFIILWYLKVLYKKVLQRGETLIF